MQAGEQSLGLVSCSSESSRKLLLVFRRGGAGRQARAKPLVFVLGKFLRSCLLVRRADRQAGEKNRCRIFF